MPDNEQCLIHYRPLPLRLGFAAWTVVLPVLCVPLVCVALIVIYATVVSIFSATSTPYIELFTALMLLLAIGLSMLGITAVLGDDRISISKDGITFPLFLGWKLGLKRQRPWGDIRLIDNMHIDRAGKTAQDKLRIEFNSGERLDLDVSKLSKEHLEGFLLACEICGQSTQIMPAVQELRQGLKKQNLALGGVSFTEVWEKELGQRFHATVFVPLDPGQRLCAGEISVVRQLAFGGLSAIYLAQRKGRELVVLKEAVLPGNADEDRKRKAMELFDREARLLAQLDHPRIARVQDHFVEDQRNYLLIEYINGPNLRQLVAQRGPQSEETVLHIAREVALILDYLHTRTPPMIHRDLTPENLLLKDNGDVVLIDFGAANEFVGTATGTIVGKQAFISPEQFRGKATLSSDIYSFGGTVHFLLTGRNPDALSVCNPQSINNNVSKGLNDLIASCTSQDPSKRPPSAAALVNQIAWLHAATPPLLASADTNPGEHKHAGS